MIRGKKKFCDWGSDKEVGSRRNIFDMEGARTSVKGCNQVTQSLRRYFDLYIAQWIDGFRYADPRASQAGLHF
jgi:hypothetical protein